MYLSQEKIVSLIAICLSLKLSINSLKSMSKIIALKIYQSNLSFIIFCPRLSTNNNKRLIKTIFYSFKILNRSPITKIYLYRPVIRNGIRSKKIPRK